MKSLLPFGAGGCAALLLCLSAACGDAESPTAPSAFPESASRVFNQPTTSQVGAMQGATPFADPKLVTDSDRSKDKIGKRQSGGSKRQGGAFRSRVEYCKNLPSGHPKYEKCQAWLSRDSKQGGGRGDKTKPSAKDRKKRRVRYCKSLEPNHADYKRCQEWLSLKHKGGGRQRR